MGTTLWIKSKTPQEEAETKRYDALQQRYSWLRHSTCAYFKNQKPEWVLVIKVFMNNMIAYSGMKTYQLWYASDLQFLSLLITFTAFQELIDHCYTPHPLALAPGFLPEELFLLPQGLCTRLPHTNVTCSCVWHYMQWNNSFIPRPLLFFVLRFTFSIIIHWNPA